MSQLRSLRLRHTARSASQFGFSLQRYGFGMSPSWRIPSQATRTWFAPLGRFDWLCRTVADGYQLMLHTSSLIVTLH